MSEIPSRRSDDARPTAAVFGVALLFYAVFIFRTSFVALGQRWFVLFEDAMISMRYARNFARGDGLVWNAGEKPVEGYTNFLWTLWMSVVHRFGLPDSKISLAIMITGVVILVSNALVVRAITREVVDQESARWAPLATVTATLFFYPLIFWTLRGMEVGALTLLVDTLLLLALRLETRWTFGGALAMGLIAGAAFLLRSDSALSCGLISAYAILVTPGIARFVTAGLIGGIFGAAVVGQGVFRKETYGETLPNTYYLKLLHVPLSARLKRGVYVALQVLAFQLAVPLAALAGALVATRRADRSWRQLLTERSERRLVLLGAIVALQLVYATYVGGDAWEWMLYANRYTTVAIPALIVLGVALLARLLDAEDGEAARLRATRTAAGVLLLAGLLLLALTAFAKVAGEQGVARTIVVSKSVALAGVVLVILGGLVFGPLGGLLRRGLISARQALATPGRASLAAIALMAVIWGPAQLQGLGKWAAGNAAQYNDEADYTRLGLLIRAASGKSFRIAVVGAGATPYFCDRPSEDILGKNDSVIAHRAPSGVFSPGHDKWDYQYSFGERHPDLVVQLVDTTPADLEYLASLGFHELPNHMYLRSDAQGVDATLIGQPVDSPAELDEALGGRDPDEVRRGGPGRPSTRARAGASR